MEAVYLEAISGFSAYKNKIAGEMSYAKNAAGSIWVQNIGSVGQIFNGSRTYAKGAVVLHMLRGIVGSETFYQIMYEYANDPDLKYGVAVTEDFQAVAERVSGMDLSYFFEEWIYGEQYPSYSIDWGYSHIGDNTYRVDFNINQAKRGTPRFFTMPVQIKISNSFKDTVITVFNTGQEHQSFSVDIIGQPSKLDIDPNNWILKEVRSVTLTGVDGETINPIRFSLEQNYPNPFNPTTTIKYSIPSDEAKNIASQQIVQLIVYDILGSEVATLVNEPKAPGNYEVTFNAKNLPSGVYIYRLKTENYVLSKKMTLLK